MRVAIVGSRDWPRLELVREAVRALTHLPNGGITVVTGCARGVDATATTAAKEFVLANKVYAADWEKYGKSAGPRRNRQIVDDCDVVLAFWDGKSRGTKNTIDQAQAVGVPVIIIPSQICQETP